MELNALKRYQHWVLAAPNRAVHREVKRLVSARVLQTRKLPGQRQEVRLTARGRKMMLWLEQAPEGCQVLFRHRPEAGSRDCIAVTTGLSD